MKADECNRCGVPLTDENWHPSSAKRRWLICKTCSNTRLREYNKKNPDVVFKRNCRKKYGLEYEAFVSMLEKQDGRCAICGTDDPGRGHKNLSIDHCHETGKVRGLLCHSCNIALGHFKDNISLLDKAKEYLNEV